MTSAQRVRVGAPLDGQMNRRASHELEQPLAIRARRCSLL